MNASPSSSIRYNEPWGQSFKQVASSPFFIFIAATAAASLIFFLRAPGAFLMPCLFAEDGQWTSSILMKGFWDTAFHVRPDYPVFGNVTLLWIGIQYCDVFLNGNFLYLPHCYAVISYLFFGATISLPILLLNKQLSVIQLGSFWLLACFMPLGLSDTWSGFEVLGRILNTGFAFIFIAFILIWYRNVNAVSPLSFVGTDFCLFICTATNPICIAMLPGILWPYIRRLPKKEQRLTHLFRDPGFISMILLFSLYLIAVGMPSPNRPYEENLLPLTAGLAVRIGLARSVLYAMVWPVYTKLTTLSVAVIFLMLVAAVCLCGKKKNRSFYLSAGYVMVLVSVVLVLFRPDLRRFFHDYSNSFPDRYFYGHQLVALLFMVIFASDIKAKLAGIKILSKIPALIILLFLIGSVIRDPFWKFSQQRTDLHSKGLLSDRVRKAIERKRYVNASLLPDPKGEYLMLSGEIPFVIMYLPREPLERVFNKNK